MKMVASLQNKKEALEAKLRDKTSELRKLCIEEAELTGILPAETPLEPGESPPQFRRRVGTVFTYPENLINKLKSKEDEALSALEIECKIQTGIAEAALGLANDGTASKSVRRKHRVLYEESKRRLSDLEARLTTLKQSQTKHKKKPRPEAEFADGANNCETEDVVDSSRHPALTVSLSDRTSAPPPRHPHGYGTYSKHEPVFPGYHQRMTPSHLPLPTSDYRHSMLDHPHHHYLARSNNPSPSEQCRTILVHSHNVLLGSIPACGGVGAWWTKGREMQYNPMVHHPLHYSANTVMPSEQYVDNSVNFNDRFGSLDRSSHLINEHESRISATLPRNVSTSSMPYSNTLVLLPSQTYPESSLMRTQSLGNMDNLKHTDRKVKEKEWYETSLDSSPSRASSAVKSDSPTSLTLIEENPTPPPPPPPHSHPPTTHPLPTPTDNDNFAKTNQASINSIHFDTVVPYESPKNHTVVQAGKWQPYREVSKPFEMSDFYKYSTKYRQSKNQPQTLPKIQDSSVSRTIHRPLPPTVNQLISPNHNSPPALFHHAAEDHVFPERTNSMYHHDKIIPPKPRSSTLV